MSMVKIPVCVLLLLFKVSSCDLTDMADMAGWKLAFSNMIYIYRDPSWILSSLLLMEKL